MRLGSKTRKQTGSMMTVEATKSGRCWITHVQTKVP